MAEYDAIIIGTGIGGAAIGALLAHDGRKVLILDKNKIVGGRCTSYEHKGFTLDLGVHLFGVGDKGSLGEVLRMTGAPDAIDWVTIRRSSQQVGGETKKYSQKDMVKSLPADEQTNLTNLFARVHMITDREIDELWYTPVETWMNEFTRHPLAHAFIGSIVGQYFCVPSPEASAAEFIKCFKEVLVARSSAYPKGGCIAIPKAYLSVAEKHGGEIRLGADVKNITVEEGAAVGVRLKDGSELRAPVIISNADIKATVRDLVGPEHFPKAYADEIMNLTYADSCIMFKIGLKERITDDQLRMYMPDDRTPLNKASEEGKPDAAPAKVGGMIVVPTNFDTSLGPDEDKQLICFGTGIRTTGDWRKRDWDAWHKALRDSIYSAFPEAQDKVLWEKMDTPQLVDAYAGEEGNIIGVGQTVDQIHKRRPSVVSPLKGLYYSSAEAGGHGIGTELAASSAMELFAALKSQ
ncbi:MAG: NAD(P)/FAD-dependent oxidoreductase [Deltaproteobacteria bacterium]|nr:NAD(P)/FAD-dependent oxidoreductase [Deltaproteobacteria bacterium]